MFGERGIGSLGCRDGGPARIYIDMHVLYSKDLKHAHPHDYAMQLSRRLLAYVLSKTVKHYNAPHGFATPLPQTNAHELPNP